MNRMQKLMLVGAACVLSLLVGCSAQKPEDQVVLGRNLFVAMTQASTEREGAGLASVWPKNRTQLSGDKDDICGHEFKSSTEYFKVLLDMDNYGKPNWTPYIYVDDITIKLKDVFDEKTGKAKWIVVKGVTDETADSVPVLVSANVEVESLLTKKGDYSREQLTGELKFAGACAVVIQKGGAASVVNAADSHLQMVYHGEFTLVNDIAYLKP